jgi:Tol biopolymer transport system component
MDHALQSRPANSMKPERWRRIEALFHAALSRPESARAAFLLAECGADEDLRHEVESLLAEPRSAGGVLEQAAMAVAVPLVSEIEPSARIGDRVGGYHIQGRLGAGGMGEVYRARDAKLGRDVAIKILPRAFGTDPERLARFDREARTLAALNHPNIGAIYGIEEGPDGTRALVLELVEGVTLSDRLERGPLSLSDALPIADQVATALECAHEHGLVHRDVKPSNIAIKPDGTIKVLDFGLAKAVAADDRSKGSAAPTLTVTQPRQGALLGTPAYMSPEQVQGGDVDQRTDVWALGVVLFEMLTGRRPFEGAGPADTLAAVLRAEPDWAALPSAPPSLTRLLRRCLEKDPRERLRNMADVRLDFRDAEIEMRHPNGLVARPPARRRAVTVAGIALAMAVGGIVGVVAVRYARSPVPHAVQFEFQVTFPDYLFNTVAMAVAPDGQRIAYAGRVSGGPKILLRSLIKASAQPIAGTDGGSNPFWSPDGRAIAFFATDGSLVRLDLDGGGRQVLSPANNWLPGGGTWNADSLIVFAADSTGVAGMGSGLLRVRATGGPPVPITTLAHDHTGHVRPWFLPDGRHLLLQVNGAPQSAGIYVVAVDGSDFRRLTTGSAPVFVEPDRLLFKRDGDLYAQNFDPARRVLSGDPTRIVAQVGGFAASRDTLAYAVGGRLGGELQWFDRSGKPLGRAGPEHANALSVELSLDEKQAVFSRDDGNNHLDVWAVDLTRNVMTRVTSDGTNRYPLLSPDGRQVIFDSSRNATRALYEKTLTGLEPEHALPETPQLLAAAADWSRDGRFVLFRVLQPAAIGQYWALPMTGDDRKPFAWLRTDFDKFDAQFSPDARWVAYGSSETGRFEIYIQSFPKPTNRWIVSSGGGLEPRWRSDGRELFYVAADGALMAVNILASSDSEGLDVGTPVRLFATELFEGFANNVRIQYAVSRDGQRFLMNTPSHGDYPSTMTVMVNWVGALGK